MILKSLTLKNYRKFKDVTIEFPDGVTGVIGLNGVGKSTIFEAIAWVVYGPVAARTSAEQIKRGGTA
jgi:exonuclease SbcC